MLFKEGGIGIGSAVPVSGGTASTTTALSSGPHTLSAVFTPADPAVFKPSSGQASYVVRAQPTASTTKSGVTPASPAAVNP